ncbi:MAG: hypothetical protein H0V17_09095 [Deltaproteobacteria bacterium]|nr:hypothetical protein [Deltaproteobacteria bacterium]
MHDLFERFRELLEQIQLQTVRLFALSTAEHALVGRLRGNSVIPARTFAVGESLYLDPRVFDLIPPGRQADVIVCADRGASWADRLPLSAFEVDLSSLVSVALVALEPAGVELAIDNVELVASWD